MPQRREPAEYELAMRKILKVEAETVSNQSSNDFPGHWPGEDHAFDIEKFHNVETVSLEHLTGRPLTNPKNFQVQFHNSQPLDSTFSVIGIDTSIANAFRRIMIAEIPTLAIEDIFMFQNTSIIQDEVLAHRIGLIPLVGDRKGLNWMQWYHRATDENPDASIGPTDYDCAILELKVKCVWQEGGQQRAAKGETDPDKLYVNHNIYASHLKWTALGGQVENFAADQPIRPASPNILIAKMRPGQEIDMLMHAFKGVGSDHAKFSPVATASYRLLPTIDIMKPIIGADADKFKRCFKDGVIAVESVTERDVEEYPELKGHEGEQKAVVRDTFEDTVSRECLRHDEFKDKVKLGRVRDHFIFRVESTGQWDSDDLFLESVKLLKLKCRRLRKGLDAMNR